MDDLERYGDYNDTDDEKKKKSPIMIFVTVLIAVMCIAVVGVLIFRISLFNYYPSNIKNIYFTDELRAYYEETNGNIGAKTQNLRAPYDDPDRGNFFCDNLIVIDGINELQISIRYNTSAIDDIKKEYEIEELDTEKEDFLTFRLVDNYGKVYAKVAHIEFASKMMYRYCKVVFENVEFSPENESVKPEWIRLEVFVDGHSEDGKPYAMIPVYENNTDYNIFSEYELKSEEKPS